MPRVKTGVTAHRRHKKVLALTKGHRATKHSLYRRAHESMLKSLSYAYSHRRERKGDMRRLWILRVNAASRAHGLTYAHFMDGLKKHWDRDPNCNCVTCRKHSEAKKEFLKEKELNDFKEAIKEEDR